MIIAAHLAHEQKKWTRRDRNRQAIANDEERGRHAERRKQQHRRCHYDAGDQSGEQPSKNRFFSAHTNC